MLSPEATYTHLIPFIRFLPSTPHHSLLYIEREKEIFFKQLNCDRNSWYIVMLFRNFFFYHFSFVRFLVGWLNARTHINVYIINRGGKSKKIKLSDVAQFHLGLSWSTSEGCDFVQGEISWRGSKISRCEKLYFNQDIEFECDIMRAEGFGECVMCNWITLDIRIEYKSCGRMKIKTRNFKYKPSAFNWYFAEKRALKYLNLHNTYDLRPPYFLNAQTGNEHIYLSLTQKTNQDLQKINNKKKKLTV